MIYRTLNHTICFAYPNNGIGCTGGDKRQRSNILHFVKSVYIFTIHNKTPYISFQSQDCKSHHISNVATLEYSLDACTSNYKQLSGHPLSSSNGTWHLYGWQGYQKRPCVDKDIITLVHYSDVIMGAMASQIPSLAIVHSTVYSSADQRKHQISASLAFVTGEFSAWMASNAENVSILWRHHARWSYFSKH